MQSISVTSCSFSHIPNPNNFLSHNINKKNSNFLLNCQTNFRKDFSQIISTENNHKLQNKPLPQQKTAFLEQLYFSFDDVNSKKIESEKGFENSENFVESRKCIENFEKKSENQKCIENFVENQKGSENFEKKGENKKDFENSEKISEYQKGIQNFEKNQNFIGKSVENLRGEKCNVEKIAENQKGIEKNQNCVENYRVENGNVENLRGEKNNFENLRGENGNFENLRGENGSFEKLRGQKDNIVKLRGQKGKLEKVEGLTSKMWWTDIKAALGQRINVEGIVGSVSVIAKDRHLVLPHVTVRDIRHIDWVGLKKSGFKGVVFDKDNTITVPYSLKLWPPLESSMGLCKSVFGNNIAVFSNSAGLYEFDPDGRKARALERTIGIKVVKHRVKKPAGTAEDIEKLFGCESSQLIMVGDRPFTDIVFGNRNGFLTILTGPLSVAEEPFIVKQVRKIEIAIVNFWSKRGLKPMNHRLLTDDVQSVKDPGSL